jgi:SulP family sulfate permease
MYKNKNTLIQDLIAGLTVSFAALSLGAAFGIMSGRGAFAGMLGAAIIPIVASIFGGTRIQASGPTAPMTAITALLVTKAYESFPGDKHFADEYITLVLMMASLLIIFTGILKLGKYIKLVPQVVVLGFMNGIALLIWVDQISKLFGLNGQTPLEGSLMVNVFIVTICLVLIYFLPFLFKVLKVPDNIKRFIPSIFIAIILITIVTTYFEIPVQHVTLGDSYNTFSEYMRHVFSEFPVDGEIFTLPLMAMALPLALQLCVLSYLDSLLTSLVIDKMTKEETKPNKELIAQGLANGLVGVLQGIPGAQATIRSVLLIKEGAQTRLAGIFVGVFALLGFIFFGKLITLIASGVFIGILLKAGLDVFDRDFPIAFLKNNWYKNRVRLLQLFFVLYTTLMTVFLDLNIAVISGTILFYLAKRYNLVVDAEDDFALVESTELS